MSERPWAVSGESAGSWKDRALLGGKALALAQLRHLGFTVPAFHVVTTRALEEALRDADLLEHGRQISQRAAHADHSQRTALAGEWRRAVEALPIPRILNEAIREIHAESFPDECVFAVRSSAACEDGIDHSFAGIFESFTNVRGIDELFSAVRRVWASMLGEKALSYAAQRNLVLDASAMAVIVQTMVEPSVSGVMFTCDPVSGSGESIIVNACRGEGTALVDGQATGVVYILPKRTAGEAVANPSATAVRQPPAPACDELIPAHQRRILLQAGLALENQLGRPQDIEFCFDQQGNLHLLQSRPVTGGPKPTTRRTPDPTASRDDGRLVWDNSNIVESYAGITLPMTFSFIRQAYAIVYHCFAEVMGIPTQVVRDNRETFENMLGLFHGRVYYNLANWYRLISLFPGYAYNRQFMEAMMGVKEKMPEGRPAEHRPWWRRWLVDLPALIGLIVRIAWRFLFIERTVQQFERRFDSNYAKWSRLDFEAMPAHEIMKNYVMMEKAMLWNWRAPIINDFFVMIHYGLLRSLCAKWCHDEKATLQNGLLCGIGNVQSTEPARRILRLAHLAIQNPSLRMAISERTPEELPQFVRSDTRFANFAAEFEDFLERFGLRCTDELKLESRSYLDDPGRVFQVIKNYLARGDVPASAIDDATKGQAKTREATEHQVEETLRGQRHYWLRRTVFRHVLANTRRGIRNRENMRLARTRIYGVLRSMLRAIGRQWHEAGILADTHDVFYLTLDEVWGYIRGTTVTTDLRGLVRVRRAEYDRFRDVPSMRPDNRFETRGTVHHGNPFRRETDATAPSATVPRLRGIGCCPGIVSGRAQVVRSPHEVHEFTGNILIAESTDPGWVAIYPGFSGILVERGSVLSHSATVARELGIPTIVAVTGLTQAVTPGQWLRIDGLSGTIELLEDRPSE